jgi:hypothetical protein
MNGPERPFLPMSGELGGDFMSGMADSIRERGAREVPAPTEEGVVEEAIEEFEEEWEEEDEWEDEEDEWDEWEEEEGDEEWGEEEWKRSLAKKILNTTKALLPRLVDFITDVATIALVPTTLMLVTIIIFQTTVFGFLETSLLLWGATAATLMIANAKTRLLQKLRPR